MQLSRRKPYRQIGFIIDIINAVFGIIVIILGAIILLDVQRNLKLFPVLFIMASFMNGVMGFKYMLRNERIKTVGLMVSAVLLMVIGIAEFVIIW